MEPLPSLWTHSKYNISKRKTGNVIKTQKLSFFGLWVLLTGLWDLKDILNSAKTVLKVNWPVKTPSHEYMEVARSGFWAPANGKLPKCCLFVCLFFLPIRVQTSRKKSSKPSCFLSVQTIDRNFLFHVAEPYNFRAYHFSKLCKVVFGVEDRNLFLFLYWNQTLLALKKMTRLHRLKYCTDHMLGVLFRRSTILVW